MAKNTLMSNIKDYGPLKVLTKNMASKKRTTYYFKTS